MTARRRDSAGFTLAELLVATMLLTIVMSAVYTLFHSTIGAWRAVDNEYDVYQQGRNAITLFQREWDNAVSQAGHLLEGDGDSITMFVDSEPMYIEDSRGPRLMRVEYKFLRGKGVIQREERTVETALPGPPQLGQELDRERIKLGHERKFIVANRVKSFKLRYIWVPLPDHYDPKDPPEPAEIIPVEHQRERWGYPQAIEISASFENPKDKAKDFEIKEVFPTRAWNFRLIRPELMKKLEGGK